MISTLQKIFKMTLLIIKSIGWIFIFPTLVSAVTPECFDGCGGHAAKAKARLEGSLFCVIPDKLFPTPEPRTKCETECSSAKPEDTDQRKCWCSICVSRPHMHGGFCKQAGVNQSIADCWPDVCAENGEAKFRGEFCDAKTEEEFQQRKANYGIE